MRVRRSLLFFRSPTCLFVHHEKVRVLYEALADRGLEVVDGVPLSLAGGRVFREEGRVVDGARGGAVCGALVALMGRPLVPPAAGGGGCCGGVGFGGLEGGEGGEEEGRGEGGREREGRRGQEEGGHPRKLRGASSARLDTASAIQTRRTGHMTRLKAIVNLDSEEIM